MNDDPPRSSGAQREGQLAPHPEEGLTAQTAVDALRAVDAVRAVDALRAGDGLSAVDALRALQL